MKVLIVEDTILKYIEIKNELAKCRNFIFFHEKSLGGAKEILEEKCKINDMFDLIVTDMRYPNQFGSDSLPDAGFQLIEFVNSLKLTIPIIICSTSQFQTRDMDNVLGSVRYSENIDLAQEFMKLLCKV